MLPPATNRDLVAKALPKLRLKEAAEAGAAFSGILRVTKLASSAGSALVGFDECTGAAGTAGALCSAAAAAEGSAIAVSACCAADLPYLILVLVRFARCTRRCTARREGPGWAFGA